MFLNNEAYNENVPSMKIGVVHYGLGNVFSVCSAVERLGVELKLCKKANDLEEVDKIILPGVGAFGDAMSRLTDKGFVEELSKEVIDKQKPYLGICLGAQLVYNTSEEFGKHAGFGWLEGVIKQIDKNGQNIRVPHTGWDNIRKTKNSILFEDIPEDEVFYFNHSFAIYSDNDNNVAAFGDYGKAFTAVVEHNNIYATQFHPEKSQKSGLKLLENFVKRV